MTEAIDNVGNSRQLDIIICSLFQRNCFYDVHKCLPKRLRKTAVRKKLNERPAININKDKGYLYRFVCFINKYLHVSEQWQPSCDVFAQMTSTESQPRGGCPVTFKWWCDSVPLQLFKRDVKDVKWIITQQLQIFLSSGHLVGTTDLDSKNGPANHRSSVLTGMFV